MPMKQPRKKEKGIHDLLVKDGFRVDFVAETHKSLGEIVKSYEEKVEDCEIENFAVVPGRLVPRAKPRKLNAEFYRNNSFVIYVRSYG